MAISAQFAFQTISLVLSTITLIFWVAYTAMLYRQIQRGEARGDWWVSMVFYAGIVLLVLANILMVASRIADTPEAETISLFVNMLALAAFAIGFYYRMKIVVAPFEMNQKRFTAKTRKGKKKG